MGYHLTEIQKGVFGKLSKIEEELEELKDAHIQGNRIMTLMELSDLYGAMRGYLEDQFSDITMKDIETMHLATKRAFEDGTRK